jgi:hypothetical protein
LCIYFFLPLFLLYISYIFSLVFLLQNRVFHIVWPIPSSFKFRDLSFPFRSKSTFLSTLKDPVYFYSSVASNLTQNLRHVYIYTWRQTLCFLTTKSLFKKLKLKHSQLLSTPKGNNFIFFSVVGAIPLYYSTQTPRGLLQKRGCSLHLSLKVLGGEYRKDSTFY